MKKFIKIINFRTFLLSAAFVIAAVLTYVCNRTNESLFVWLLFIESAVLVMMFFIYRSDKTKLISLVLVTCCFISAIVSCAIWNGVYSFGAEDKYISDELYLEVRDVNDDGLNQSIVADILNDDISPIGKVVIYPQNARFESIDLSELRSGDRLLFYGRLESIPLISGDGTVNGYYYRLGIQYRCYVSWTGIHIEKGTGGTWLERLHGDIERIMVENLGDTYGKVAYGMLTGDKGRLDVDIRNYFSVSGIGHILAVSGLHIMFLSAVIMWLCSRAKMRPITSFCITAVLLMFYTVFADFSPSVVRATVMSLCLMSSKLIGERSDPLNNLGFACTLFLIFRPYVLFDAGFIMSVAAVFGIILFSKPIFSVLEVKVSEKFHWLIKAFSVTLSAQIGLLPAMCYYFSSFSLYSIVVNVMLLYVIMFTFIGLIISVILTGLLPFAGFIFKIPYVGLWTFDAVSAFVSGLPFAKIVIYAGSASFIVYVLYFVMSRFVLKRKLKWPIIILSGILCFVMIGAYNIGLEDMSSRIYFWSDGSAVCSIVVCDNGSVVLIADKIGVVKQTEVIKQLKIHKLDEVIVGNMDYEQAKTIVRLTYKVDVERIYFPFGGDLEGVALLEKYGCDYYALKDDDRTVCGVNMVFKGGVYNAAMNIGGETAVFLNRSVKLADIYDELLIYSIVRSYNCNIADPRQKMLCNVSAYEHGGRIFTCKNGVTYYDCKSGNTG